MWGRARLGTGSVDRFGDPRASSEHILFLPARPDNQFASDADLDSGHAIYRSLQASGALRCVRPVGGSPRCEWRRQAGRCRRVWLLGSSREDATKLTSIIPLSNPHTRTTGFQGTRNRIAEPPGTKCGSRLPLLYCEKTSSLHHRRAFGTFQISRQIHVFCRDAERVRPDQLRERTNVQSTEPLIAVSHGGLSLPTIRLVSP